MGVNITKIVPREKITLESLSNKAIALDAFNSIFQFLSIVRDFKGCPLRDHSGRITSHLSGLFYRSINLLEKGIKPVYVFDGKPPKRKKEEIERRVRIRRESREKYVKALSEERYDEARKYAMASSSLEDYMIEDAKRLLQLMGIPVVEALEEGEAQASYMSEKGDAWATGSQDYDTLLFGSPRVVRNITLTGKKYYPSRGIAVKLEPEIIKLEKVLSKHGLTREQLIDIGILVGTDYNSGVRGLGPVKALQAIKEHGCIENIPGIEEKIFLTEVEEVRGIFLNPKVSNQYSIQLKNPDSEGIRDFLCGERTFSKERVDKALVKINNEKGRNALDRWFE